MSLPTPIKLMAILFYKAEDHYGCFSNFSPHPIYIQGDYWPTVEHYYQAQKFQGTDLNFLMTQIWEAPTPKAATVIGRHPNHRPREDWEEIKLLVMAKAVWQKFITHGELTQILLATENEELIENSPKDYYWGCGADNTGRNELGKLLMVIREKLRQS
jgi:ribA/ribD-fused uncharacterized protein